MDVGISTVALTGQERTRKSMTEQELEETFDDIFPWASDEALKDAEYLRLRAEYVEEEMKRDQEILKAAGLSPK
jgi:hypothetical protein